jgi:hypothetical protein
VADRLTVRFETRQTERGRQPVVEVAGIPQAMLNHFSRRRARLLAQARRPIPARTRPAMAPVVRQALSRRGSAFTRTPTTHSVITGC